MTLGVVAARSQVIGEPPRVKLTVTSTTGAPSPTPLNSLLTLWRVHPDGTEHRVILPAEARVIGGSWVGFDYHAPYNGAVSWRVEAAGFSATSGPVWVLCDSTWLISATTPGLSVQVKVAAIGDQSRPTRSGEFTPVGGDTLFISDGKRGGMVGSIAVRVPAAGVGDIVTLLADDGVILINTPGTVGWDVKWQWAQVTDQGLSNLGGWKGYPNRVVPLPFKAAAEPDVDLVNPWNAGIAAAYFLAQGVNAGAVSALYADSAAFKTNTRSA